MPAICFFIDDQSRAGGSERVASTIANELALLNYEVCILSLKNGQESFFELHSSIRLFSINVTPSTWINYICTVQFIRKFLRENAIDTFIVVESMLALFSVPALLGTNVKQIVWEHFNFKINLGRKLRVVARQWAGTFADYVVTLTETDRLFWQNGLLVPRAKVVTISNPIPCLEKDLACDLNAKLVIGIGRLTYQKGFDLMIKSWRIVANEISDWKLKIIGDGEDRTMLSQLIREYRLENQIELMAATKNIDHYYANASIFCLSSRFEGLPMVLIEALACKMPIVSFDCDTGPREVVDHGKNGFCVESGNIEALAEALIQLMSDHILRNEMSQKSVHIASRFKRSLIMSEWLKII